MLVVTRKEGQTLSIGEDIRVMIVKIRGKQVRLGIKAPPHLLVVREDNLPEGFGPKANPETGGCL